MNLLQTLSKHKVRYITSITGAIALILVCALIVSQWMPKSADNGAPSVAQGKTTSAQPVVKTNFQQAQGEFRAVWISFQDYGDKAYTQKGFQQYINKTFDDCKKKGFNAVIAHVRPFADAIYPSSYFPWSK